MAGALKCNQNLLIRQRYNSILAILNIRVSHFCKEADPYNLASLKRGTGGRCSFNGIVATVFGNSGFLGPYVCNKLGKIGTQLILPYRCDEYDVKKLKLCGDLGQVLFKPFLLRNETDLYKSVKYSNVVINLIGRDWETKNFKFDDVHVKGARAIAKAAKRAGVKRLIHVSALNVSEKPTPCVLQKGSQFLASKWRGEKAVLVEFPEATIIRPADMYGQGDRFLFYYAHKWRTSFGHLPLWEKGLQTIKQPVYADDVATAIVNVIKHSNTAGNIYQAVGPKRYYLSELVDWFYRVMNKDKDYGYKRTQLSTNLLFRFKVSLTQRVCLGFPVGNLHWERIERESVTDSVSSYIPTLVDLDVKLTPMEDRIPWELKPFFHEAYYYRDLDNFSKPPAPPKVVH